MIPTTIIRPAHDYPEGGCLRGFFIHQQATRPAQTINMSKLSSSQLSSSLLAILIGLSMASTEMTSMAKGSVRHSIIMPPPPPDSVGVNIDSEAAWIESVSGVTPSYDEGIIVYPIIPGGHTEAFRRAYLHAYAVGADHLSFHEKDDEYYYGGAYVLILDYRPGDLPGESRYLLSDSTYLSMETGFIPGDTIWIEQN